MISDKAKKSGVTIHWTGLLDWTEVFSIFGQDSTFKYLASRDLANNQCTAIIAIHLLQCITTELATKSKVKVLIYFQATYMQLHTVCQYSIYVHVCIIMQIANDAK